MLQQVYIIRTTFFSFINYVYIIVDTETRKAAIVDPSWELNKIVDKLKDIGAELTTILLTHSHMDHVNLVDQLVYKTNAQVYMSSEEVDTYNFSCKNLNKISDWEIIKLGESKIVGLLTPGHTEGSVCYLISNGLFTGDTIFNEGCGICPDHTSASQMFHSLQRVKKDVKRDVMVYPGHRYARVNTFSLEKVINDNIYFQIDDEQKFIDFRMRKSQKNLFKFV